VEDEVLDGLADEEEGGGGAVPLLIDATLPVLRRLSPGAANARGREWRALMLEMGVTAVKAVGSCPYSTDAARGLDWAFLCDWRRLFAGLKALKLPEVAFGNAAGQATALAVAWLESGGAGAVCSLGGAGGLPELGEVRRAVHVRGILPLKSPDAAFRRMRRLGEALRGGARTAAGVKAA
jgi:hypothetical protein